MPAISSFLESRKPVLGRFASESDYAECRRLHRKYGTTYYFASRRFAPNMRKRIDALYGFVRVPDEWVDNPQNSEASDPLGLLTCYREQLLSALQGVPPQFPTLRAFADVIAEIQLDVDEPLLFLEAMEADLSVKRYENYSDLRRYMRGSAVAVGRMMCAALGADKDPSIEEASDALAEAMQLTNFLRDVGEDARRGRIYLPLEDLARFEVTEEEVLEGRRTERFECLMRFEIERARELYSQADPGIPLLPCQAQLGIRLARVLYSRILEKIEAANYDVFSRRARTSTLEKLAVATTLCVSTTR